MNKLAQEQILKDYSEILNLDAGRRVFGGIFQAAKLNNAGLLNDYRQGYRDLALAIANTMREINPHLVADCEIAFRNFVKEFDNGADRADYDTGSYD